MIIEEIYRTLNEQGLVRSQVEFSRVWLGKSGRYYSSMLARQQQPGVGTLTGVLFRLSNVMDHTDEGKIRAALSLLKQRLERHVTMRSITGRLDPIGST